MIRLNPELSILTNLPKTTATSSTLTCYFTHESYFEAVSFAAWLCDRIRQKVPTSIIRLGDGEGNFLAYEPDSAHHQQNDIKRIQSMWWKTPRMDTEAVNVFMGWFARTVAHADAIGIPPPKHLVSLFSNKNESATKRGLASAMYSVVRIPSENLASKVLTSNQVHSDLDKWDLYPQILNAAPSVSVVSCFDLRDILWQKFGVEVRTQYKIPPEHAHAGKFKLESENLEVFYPTIFERIMNEITPLPGELFLVAAGFLGKFICARICERGGIGFDAGSVVDSWMGHLTRVYAPRNESNFNLSIPFIEGHPFQKAGAAHPNSAVKR